MPNRSLAMFLVLLALVLVWPVRLTAKEPATAPSAAYHITGPFTHDNLSIYLIHGAGQAGAKTYLTLQEALEQKKVVVHETQQVNALTIENLSDDDVYIQAGEIVKGGQQDRTLARDLIVSAHSGQVPIAAHCVEHGRWTRRGDEQVAQFGASQNVLASKALKSANYAGDQSGVWREVNTVQEKLADKVTGYTGHSTTSPSSLELSVEAPQVQASVDPYVTELSKATDGKDDVIGYAFAINGKLNSGDVYASHALFTKLWPKLLTAAAIEATTERPADGAVAEKFDAPKPAAVAAALADADAGVASAVADRTESEAVLSSNTINAPANGPAIQRQARQSDSLSIGTSAAPVKADDRVAVTKCESEKNVRYETTDAKADAPYVHRAYLTK